MRLPKLPKLNIQKLDALKARASALFERLKPALATAKDRTAAFFKSIRLPKLDLPKFHISQIFYEPKHEKDAPVTSLALTRTVVISAVGILFCMACLFGLTWAWYTSTVTTAPSTITAAGFDVSATVKAEGSPALTADADGWYTLAAETKYSVSLKNIGTAKTGFCQLLVITPTAATATPYYTDSIPQIDEATETENPTEPFIFTLSGVSKIKFTAMWGQCPEDPADRVVHYGDTLSLGTAADFDGEETEQDEPEPEDDPSAKTAAPSATEPQQTESTAGAETAKIPETTGTPETTQAKPSETEGGEGETSSETPSGSEGETPTE